jgi:hypothetical protein
MAFAPHLFPLFQYHQAASRCPVALAAVQLPAIQLPFCASSDRYCTMCIDGIQDIGFRHHQGKK